MKRPPAKRFLGFAGWQKARQLFWILTPELFCKTMHRTIIHLNIADFAVAVERTLDRQLRERPVIIAPLDAPRAAVHDMSEEAYQAGVHKGMPLAAARRLCREAHLQMPRFGRYAQAMAALLKRARPFTPLIEPGADDGHLFLDITGTQRLHGPPEDVARHLRRQIRDDLGFTPIWSVAANKVVAKVATRIVKPLGTCSVAPGNEAAFLAPLPLGLIPGLGSPDLQCLQEFNLTRVSQVTALGADQLAVPFGRRAARIYETLQGVDPEPVRPLGAPPPEVNAGYTFATDTNGDATIRAVLYRLAERIGRRLRRQNKVAGKLVLRLRYADSRRQVRQIRLRPATSDDIRLFGTAGHLLERVWIRRVRIRALHLTATALTLPAVQLELFAPEARAAARQTALIRVMDSIRDRFGSRAIQPGRTLGLAPSA